MLGLRQRALSKVPLHRSPVTNQAKFFLIVALQHGRESSLQNGEALVCSSVAIDKRPALD
jgi:hypothetical protein